MLSAHLVYDNPQLWADIAAGKKYLTWRIGHTVHTVTAIDKVDGKLFVTLDGSTKRHVKNNATFETHWNHHPEYRAIAEQVLANVQARVDFPVELLEEPDAVYRFQRTVPNKGTIGANCMAGLFEHHSIDYHTAPIIEILSAAHE